MYIDACCSVIQFSYTRELLHVGLCTIFLSTRFVPKFRVKPVYVICRLWVVRNLSFWVGFWRSGNAHNVQQIVRMRQRASSYKVATSQLWTGDFADLPLVVNSCGGPYGPSSTRDHDDSLFVAVRGLICTIILLCTPFCLIGVLCIDIALGRSAVQFTAALLNSLCVHCATLQYETCDILYIWSKRIRQW